MSNDLNTTPPRPSNSYSPVDEGNDGFDSPDETGSLGNGDFDPQMGDSHYEKNNITRQQILSLFEKAAGRPDQKVVENELRDILRDIASGNQDKAWGDYEKLPEDFLSSAQESADAGDGSQSGSDNDGNAPTRTEDLPGYGKTEVFDDLKTKDYSFTPDFKSSVKNHKVVTNGGKVVISGTTSQDTAEVKKNDNGTYEVKIHKGGQTDAANTETYIVDGPPQQIVVDVMSKNIQSQLPANDTVVQLGTGADSNNVNWDGAAVANNLPPGDGSKEAQELTNRVDAAMHGNDTSKWKDVTDYLSSLWPSQNTNHNPSIMAGPVLRKFLTALYKVAGSNDDKMKALLSKLDPGFRREMVRCLDHFATGVNIYRIDANHMDGQNSSLPPDTYYGQDAKNEGDQWGNAAARDIVAAAPQNAAPPAQDPSGE